MAGTKMQEQDVPSGSGAVLVDIKCVEEDQNPGEIPQPLLLGDKTLAVGCDVKGKGKAKANGHENNGDVGVVGVVDHSEKKTGDENTKKRKTWLLTDSVAQESDEAGTPEEQKAFVREVETFYRENFLEFKAAKFYGQPLNILKLWRAVVKLGGYDVVTASKQWRQVGESFHPPKTCTTVSYTFRLFYEKALLEYEKYLWINGDLNLSGSAFISSPGLEKGASSHQGAGPSGPSGSGRVRRDSATRAMQGWQQRLVGSGEFLAPKDKVLNTIPKPKKLKIVGLQPPKPQTNTDLVVSHEADKQSNAEVVDDGPLADWVKITVKENKDFYEVYALVPGLLRKEVRVQSDPVGRLVITGEPEQLDNPWGITPFKKIVHLSARIDPLRISAVLSMHGRLYIKAHIEKE
ncbi:AT-rich interactive domain-containing protein 6 [Cardamine amara subsp. amara]|uniref:AT-rich interactive domain-containing protein 6 n=1 Tax=Cardamine amara subsp. amara TaxID=228776 RepID=A0ABD1BRE6_CARAN